MPLRRISALVVSLGLCGLFACSSEPSTSAAPAKARGGNAAVSAGGAGATVGAASGGAAGDSSGSASGGLSAAGSSPGGATSTTDVSYGGTTSTVCIKASAGMAGSVNSAAGAGNEKWVGTWVAAQQLTETSSKPPAPGLTDSTLRQIVHVSIGGTQLRLRFSNEYGTTPITINAAHCAASTGTHTIDPATDKELTFGGVSSVTIPAKQAATSDPIDFQLAPLSNLAVTIAFGAMSTDITGHPGSRTTSFLQAGNAVSAPSMPTAVTTDHWYVLSGIDVMADADAHAIVILGDSITDGRGSTTNGNDRWPDVLARRLQANPATTKIAVLNQGIGGNAVFNGGLGPIALQRFDHDVLQQSGVRWLILFEGVNDIGNGDSSVATNLTIAFKQFVTKAHAANIAVYGVPILPFNGHSYYSAAHEEARQTVNAWIRTPGNLDGVIDLEAAVRDPAKPDTLLPAYDSGDHLHLNPTGYRRMGDSVDVCLFAQ